MNRERERKEIFVKLLYIFPFYIWRRIGRCILAQDLIERKKGRVCSRSPFDTSVPLQEATRPKIRERVCRVPLNPEILLLPRANPTLVYFSSFAARRRLPLSTLRSVHGKTPARVTANMFLRSLKIVRSVCNTPRIMRHNASFFPRLHLSSGNVFDGT